MNCTPFVRQSDIMSNKRGDFYAKGSTKQTIHAGIQETGRGNHAKEKLSYCETARQFEVSDDKRVAAWERIYLTEGPEGFAIERRGRSSKGRSGTLPKEVEEDLLAEVQRLRAENEYLKIASLGFGRRATSAQKRW